MSAHRIVCALFFSTLLALLSGCGSDAQLVGPDQDDASFTHPGEETGVDLADGPGTRVVSDGANGGNERFFFLPPMVPDPSPFLNPFDPTANPVATICVWGGASCTGAPVATFTTSGMGPDVLTVDLDKEQYTAVYLGTGSLALSPGTMYRLSVEISGVEIGFADLWVVNKKKDLRRLSTEFIGVVRGVAFVIKFRIEEGALEAARRAPTAEDDMYTTPQNTTLAVTDSANGLLPNDDVGQPAAPVVSFGGGSLPGDASTNLAGATVNFGTGGSLTVNADGTFSFTPETDFSGLFTFDYRIENVEGSSDATVTIGVGGAPMAVDDGPAGGSSPGDPFHAFFNTTLNVADSANGLLPNDMLGFPTATLVSFGGGSLPGDASTNPAGNTVNFGTGGSLTVNADGTFSFTPSNDFTGEFTFDYRIQNTEGSDDGTVTIAVGERPNAADDTYTPTVVGNVSIDTQTSTNFSVLTNDDGDGVTVALNTPSNGDVTVNPDGTFTFDPAPGYEGPAGFSYDLTNGFGTVTGNVSITVAGMIWFVDNNAAPGGDGRLSGPFNCLVSAGCFSSTASDDAGDHIFLYESATAYTAGLTLLNNQKLIGQDATTTLGGITGLTPPADSPALPLLNSGNATTVDLSTTGGTAIVLGSGNTIRGLETVTNTSGAGITGASVGTLNISEVAVVSATNGVGVDLAGGALNVTFESVSASGGTNGIKLANTTGSFTVTGAGATDPSVVVGTRGRKNTTNTGGVIASTTGDGVSLSNADNVTLRNMTIGDASATPAQPPDATVNITGDGIDVSNNSTNLTLDNVLIAKTGGHGIVANTLTGLTVVNSEILNAGNAVDEDAVQATELLGGASTIKNTIIDGMWSRGIDIRNDTNTGLDMLVVQNVVVTDNHPTDGENAIRFNSQGTGNFRLDVLDSKIQNVEGNGIVALPGATSDVHLEVKRTAIIGSGAAADVKVPTAVQVNPSGNGDASFVIADNNPTDNAVDGGGFTDIVTAAIILKNDSNGSLSGTVDDNAVTSGGEGLFVVADGMIGPTSVTGSTTVDVSNNVMTSSNAHGMLFSAQDGAVTLDVTLNANTTTGNGPAFSFQNGIFMDVQTGTACFNLATASSAGNNNATAATGGGEGIFLQKVGGTVNLESFGGGNDAAAATFINTNNTSTPAAFVFSSNTVGTAACASSPP